MKYHSISFIFLIFLSCLAFTQCGNKINKLETSSPDGKIKVDFFISEDGTAGYLINFSDKIVIDTSYISFDFQNAEFIRKEFGNHQFIYFLF